MVILGIVVFVVLPPLVSLSKTHYEVCELRLYKFCYCIINSSFLLDIEKGEYCVWFVTYNCHAFYIIFMGLEWLVVMLVCWELAVGREEREGRRGIISWIQPSMGWVLLYLESKQLYMGGTPLFGALWIFFFEIKIYIYLFQKKWDEFSSI